MNPLKFRLVIIPHKEFEIIPFWFSRIDPIKPDKNDGWSFYWLFFELKYVKFN